MNKKTILLLFLASLTAILCLTGFSRPSIEQGWLLIVFFIFYFGMFFFGLQTIGGFLGFRARQLRAVSFIASSIILSIQILVTFQALRPVELLLITSVLVLIGWYISKTKS